MIWHVTDVLRHVRVHAVRATGRKSWIVIGFIAFAAGAVAAASIFSHVGSRVDAWLHPFSAAQYNKEYGGSYQLVTGIFGLASGGLMGTGLGQGHPSITRSPIPTTFTQRWAKSWD